VIYPPWEFPMPFRPTHPAFFLVANDDQARHPSSPDGKYRAAKLRSKCTSTQRVTDSTWATAQAHFDQSLAARMADWMADNNFWSRQHHREIALDAKVMLSGAPTTLRYKIDRAESQLKASTTHPDIHRYALFADRIE